MPKIYLYYQYFSELHFMLCLLQLVQISLYPQQLANQSVEQEV